MTAQTSIKAHNPTSATRAGQRHRIFEALLQFSHMGEGATCEQLVAITRIKDTSVYGRLDSMKNGYTVTVDGQSITYYVVVKAIEKKEGREVQVYTLTEDQPTPTAKDLEKMKRAALSSVRKWRAAQEKYISSQLKTLFDK